MPADKKISRAMLDFAQRWSPYGGGRDEDILIELSLSSSVFFERVLAMLATQPNALEPGREKLIKAVALKRLLPRLSATGHRRRNPNIAIAGPLL